MLPGSRTATRIGECELGRAGHHASTVSDSGGRAIGSSSRRVADKDRHAFETLYQRYGLRLQRYLSRQIQSPELTEEILDDVMLVVWQSAERYNQTSRVSTWIFGIAHHKALKARARLASRPATTPLSDDEAAGGEGSGGRHDAGELDRLLARGLAELSPEQRAVVELTFYHGWSYQEIAEITRAPVNTGEDADVPCSPAAGAAPDRARSGASPGLEEMPG